MASPSACTCFHSLMIRRMEGLFWVNTRLPVWEGGNGGNMDERVRCYLLFRSARSAVYNARTFDVSWYSSTL